MIVNIFILAATAGKVIGVPDFGWHIIFLDIEWPGSLNVHHSIEGLHFNIFFFSPNIFSNAGHTLDDHQILADF